MERQPGMELGIASPCWAVAEQARAGRAPAVAAVSCIFVVWSVGRHTLDSHAKCRRRTRPAKPVAAHCSSSIFALLTILVNLARSVLIGAANWSGVEMKGSDALQAAISAVRYYRSRQSSARAKARVIPPIGTALGKPAVTR